MLQAIKLTFGSVWGWLGIIVGAISLINLGVMYFDVGIGPILEQVVVTYKLFVHQGFDYLLFWVPMIWPNFEFAEWAKDATALYLVFAASCSRFLFEGEDSKSLRVSERVEGVIYSLIWPSTIIAIVRNFFSSDFDEEGASDLVWLLLNFVAVPLTAFIFVMISSGVTP